MTDFNVDSPPPSPFGRPRTVGEQYIDTKTGQTKIVVLNGPDEIIVVGEPKTTETLDDSNLQPFSKLVDLAQKRGSWSKLAGWTSNLINKSGDLLSKPLTGGLINPPDLGWGFDRSASGTDGAVNNDLFAWRKADLTEDQAEKLIEKIKNSGLIELAEAIGRHSRIC